MLSVTVASEPPDGVFFTVKALLARLAAGARFSSKVMTRDAPFAAADANAGAVLSVGARVPLTAIFRRALLDAHVLPELIVYSELSAIDHPGEPPESSLPERVLLVIILTLLEATTTKYLVEALSVVALAGVKLCSPAVATLPVRSTTLVPGTSTPLTVVL